MALPPSPFLCAAEIEVKFECGGGGDLPVRESEGGNYW